MKNWLKRWFQQATRIRELEIEVAMRREDVLSARAVLVEWRRTMPQSQQAVANRAIADLELWEVEGRPSGPVETDKPFLVLPTAVLNSMPEGWRVHFVDLLNEMEKTFPNAPDPDYRVMTMANGKYTSVPDVYKNSSNVSPNVLAIWRGQ